MTIVDNDKNNGKLRNSPPSDEGENSIKSWEEFSLGLSPEREKLKEMVNTYFSCKYYPLEVCLSVKALHLIDDVTLPFWLTLIGAPGSGKSVILTLVESLPDCYRTDSFTPKSFISHIAGVNDDQISKSIDLLTKIKNQTLITPELSSLFSTREDRLLESLGILTRILDGKGFQSNSGVHGQRGSKGDIFFTWLGAVVEIPNHVWKMWGNLGPKAYQLRLFSDIISEEEKQRKMLDNLKSKSHSVKLAEATLQIQSFWNKLLQFPNHAKGKIVWDFSRDNLETLQKIALLAQTLSKLRGSIPTYQTAHSGGSNYNYESPVIEDPQRALVSLYNLARGHAVLYGRNFITRDDLRVIVAIVFSSAAKERIEMFRLLIQNNGEINTEEFARKTNVSKPTALKNMKELFLVGLADEIKEPSITKSIKAIKIKEFCNWFLTDEFKKYLDFANW